MSEPKKKIKVNMTRAEYVACLNSNMLRQELQEKTGKFYTAYMENINKWEKPFLKLSEKLNDTDPLFIYNKNPLKLYAFAGHLIQHRVGKSDRNRPTHTDPIGFNKFGRLYGSIDPDPTAIQAIEDKEWVFVHIDGGIIQYGNVTPFLAEGLISGTSALTILGKRVIVLSQYKSDTIEKSGMFRCVDLICDSQDKKNLELKTDDIFKKVDATKTVIRASMIDLVDNSEDTPVSMEEEIVIEDDDFELPDESQENPNLGDNQGQQDGLIPFSKQNNKRNKGSK